MYFRKSSLKKQLSFVILFVVLWATNKVTMSLVISVDKKWKNNIFILWFSHSLTGNGKANQKLLARNIAPKEYGGERTLGFFSVGWLTLWTDAEESTEVTDTSTALQWTALKKKKKKSPFLLQSCRRASSFMDIIKVQSYELLGWEDICHTKHWISFVWTTNPINMDRWKPIRCPKLDWWSLLAVGSHWLASSSTTDWSTNRELDYNLD